MIECSLYFIDVFGRLLPIYAHVYASIAPETRGTGEHIGLRGPKGQNMRIFSIHILYVCKKNININHFLSKFLLSLLPILRHKNPKAFVFHVQHFLFPLIFSLVSFKKDKFNNARYFDIRVCRKFILNIY